MTRLEIIIGRVVVRTRREEGIVCADFQHVFAAQRGSAVQCEVVCLVVDGAPVREVGLEGRFDFPVLDEVLDEEGEAAGFVGHFLGCQLRSLVSVQGCGWFGRRRTLFVVGPGLAVVRRTTVTPGGVCVVEDRIGVQNVVGKSCGVAHCVVV